MINIYNGGKRVACHTRSNSGQYGHTTLKEHMPEAHRHHASWTPERFEQWASDIGVATHSVVSTMLKAKGHPQQAFRSISSLLSLSKKYDRVRLENACARALQIGSPTRTSVQSILKKGLDKLSLQEEKAASIKHADAGVKEHENIRGSKYFH